MRSHLLQSETWENYEKLEGKTTFRLTGETFDCLATKSTTPFGPYLYLPYGPTFKTKNGLRKALEALVSLAKTEDAYFVRIEPTRRLEAQEIASTANSVGLKARKSQNLDPEHTWILDLADVTEDDLLKNMESRKVRYWRNAEKKGIKIRTTKDPSKITILTNFLKDLGEKDNFTPQTENHLKNQLKTGFATLYIAELSDVSGGSKGGKPSSEGRKTWPSGPERPEEERFAALAAPTNHPERPEEETFRGSATSPAATPIAAALVYDHEGVRYYAHAATDFDHRKLQAGSIILIQLILDAKKNGAKTFDFWGITKSTDPNHPWYHFTQYKKSFGGHELAYSGTYDLILDPKKYKLYAIARKLNRWLRKLKK